MKFIKIYDADFDKTYYKNAKNIDQIWYELEGVCKKTNNGLYAVKYKEFNDNFVYPVDCDLDEIDAIELIEKIIKYLEQD